MRACWAWSLSMVLAGVASADPMSLVRSAPPGAQLRALLPEDGPKLDLPEYVDEMDQAEALLNAGRYRAALYKLAGVPPQFPVRQAIVEGVATRALGRHDQSLAALERADVVGAPAVRIERALTLEAMGKPGEAIASLQQLLADDDAHPRAHLELGRLLERVGDLDAARQQYAWFVEGPVNYLRLWQTQQEFGFDNAETLLAAARGIDRWATLHAKYPELPGLNDTVLAMLTSAYDTVQRGFWPAHLAAAEYYVHHNNNEEAAKELQLAAAYNPRDARLLELAGRLALEGFNFDGADAAIAEMRQVNRASLRADLLEARNLLLQRRPGDAEPALRRVLEQQPDHLEALGLLAGVRSLQLRDDEARALLKQVEAIDPDNASAYFEVAEQLAALRQYPRAAEMYKVAIERAPWWTSPRNGLGLLYTQSGDEDDARAVLRDAYALDPYNARTVNYLTLLDRLAAFERVETEHFIIMFDKAIDPIIGKLFADRLEQMHTEIEQAFRHEPAVKTMIEVFPTHAGFSVRTTGSPWIGTVGASTGRVIALVSPRREGNTLGTFNWLQVLRHEYVHTVTLSMTENRIPHWMTEGLAVLEERVPLRWEWVPMLYHAVSNDELFTMEGLTWGFVRPRRPIDRQLAYAQSFWTCQFIEETFGREKLLAMLEGFRGGKSEAAVFEEVLGVTLDAFYGDFVTWTKQQVATWGYDDVTSAKYESLRETGEALIKSRDYTDALSVWLEAQQLRPMDPLPHQRLAGLYLTRPINQPQKAAEHLRVLHGNELKDNRYAERLARLYRDAGNLHEALKVAEEAVLIEPYDLDAHRLLLEIAQKRNDAELVARQQQLIAIIEPWRKTMRDQLRVPDAPPVAE